MNTRELVPFYFLFLDPKNAVTTAGTTTETIIPAFFFTNLTGLFIIFPILGVDNFYPFFTPFNNS